MTLFPIASGGDFAGLIFFAIFAVIAWLTNRAKGAGEDQGETSKPTGGGEPTADDTLEEWLKGLVDEQKNPPKQHQPPPVRPSPATRPPPLTRPQRPPPLAREQRRTAPPPLRSEPPRRAPPVQRPAPVTNRPSILTTPPVISKKTIAASRLAPNGPDIHEEIHDLALKVADEVHITSDELIGIPPGVSAEPPSDSTQPPLIARMLRSQGGLRQGVILMEILGKPRALSTPQF